MWFCPETLMCVWINPLLVGLHVQNNATVLRIYSPSMVGIPFTATCARCPSLSLMGSRRGNVFVWQAGVRFHAEGKSDPTNERAGRRCEPESHVDILTQIGDDGIHVNRKVAATEWISVDCLFGWERVRGFWFLVCCVWCGCKNHPMLPTLLVPLVSRYINM